MTFLVLPPSSSPSGIDIVLQLQDQRGEEREKEGDEKEEDEEAT